MSSKWPEFFKVLESDDDEYIIVGKVNGKQLETIYQVFEPVSRSWRGQYQAMAKAIVSGYEDFFDLPEE